MQTVLLWFRQDLRLADNPALQAALLAADNLIPVYIWDDNDDSDWKPGAATRWWLHYSLLSLDQSLRQRGSCLVLRKGPAKQVLSELMAITGAKAIFANRLYEPLAFERDKELASVLPLKLSKADLLAEPWELKTGTGGPYKVFTAFWKKCQAECAVAPLLPAPLTLPLKKAPESLPLEALELLPRIPWDSHMRRHWECGETAAQQQLDRWIHGALNQYAVGRNLPGQPGTSQLSPHLHFGELSPQRVWHAVRAVSPDLPEADCRVFLNEIGWREFAHHVLRHFPHTAEKPLDVRFEAFPWDMRADWLKAWQRGQTGYPIVDAGMRELWALGWMHNRVRMIVASFLTKDLLIPWIAGARWFWDTLVDADLAANSLNWQWAAGCGADAAPFFRIFNPVSQGEKFDPKGAYVRHWVPELASLPDKWLHRPWEAPAEILTSAGVCLGQHYPHPIVDHGRARTAALEAFASIKASKV